jgi:hypothetical protein
VWPHLHATTLVARLVVIIVHTYFGFVINTCKPVPAIPYARTDLNAKNPVKRFSAGAGRLRNRPLHFLACKVYPNTPQPKAAVQRIEKTTSMIIQISSSFMILTS